MVKNVFIIAEAGVNHNGRLALAKKLVDAAVSSGADAVKFQTFDAKRLASATAPKATYQKQTTGKAESQIDMLKRLQLSEADHYKLRDYCKLKKIMFLSTPFDEASADFLNQLKMPFFKVPSGEITNLPYIRHVANFHKPLIVSTGMADLAEVREAVNVIKRAGNRNLTLLHCVSNYPAAAHEVNLRAMQTLAQTFKVPVGFSDHTLGIDMPIAAVALGASVIEKHLTLDHAMKGPDHRMSLEPVEFKAMVDAIRRVTVALGDGVKKPVKSETNVAHVARKSLVAARVIERGAVIRYSDIILKRPGTGLSSKFLNKIIGRKAKKMIKQDQMLSLGMVS